jgi:hypothetical protein
VLNLYRYSPFLSIKKRIEMDVTHTRLLEGAQTARGVAVIIDVFRAFTCEPLLFSLGIEKSILVATPEEALALKEKKNELVLIGEVGGIPVEGFDLGNSPSEILKKALIWGIHPVRSLKRAGLFLKTKPWCTGHQPAFRVSWPRWMLPTKFCRPVMRWQGQLRGILKRNNRHG